ncbi:Organic cation transporter 1 [Exaiptasia diaphana]|nr:Organic cation transporter 1 [Exaiptasia diaphana]
MPDKDTHTAEMREFDDIFQHLNSFGRYQKIVFFSVHMIIVPVAMQNDALVFGFSTPHFHCVTPNVTCEDTKCCSDYFPMATTALTLIGFIAVDSNWFGVYVITSEIFPTVVRNTGQGVGSATARFGALLAPYISMMSQLPGLGLAFPIVIFGVLALVAGILMYWIPETLYAPMHQTIGEAESAEEDFGIPCCGKKKHQMSSRVLIPLSDDENMNDKENELI